MSCRGDWTCVNDNGIRSLMMSVDSWPVPADRLLIFDYCLLIWLLSVTVTMIQPVCSTSKWVPGCQSHVAGAARLDIPVTGMSRFRVSNEVLSWCWICLTRTDVCLYMPDEIIVIMESHCSTSKWVPGLSVSRCRGSETWHSSNWYVTVYTVE